MPRSSRPPSKRAPRSCAVVQSRPSPRPLARCRPMAPRLFVPRSARPVTGAKGRHPCARHSARPVVRFHHHRADPSAPPVDLFHRHRVHVDPCRVRRVELRVRVVHVPWALVQHQAHRVPEGLRVPAARAPASVDLARVDPRRVRPPVPAAPDPPDVVPGDLAVPSARPRVAVVAMLKSSSRPK